MVKASELLELDEDELEHRLSDAKQELFNLRFQLATGQLDNASRIRQVRRDVARVKTLIRQREIRAAESYWSQQNEAEASAVARPEDGVQEEES